LPNWPSEYPDLKGKPAIKGAKTFICFPIEKSGTPVAAFGVFSNFEIHPNIEVEAFLKAIGNVISLHLYRGGQASREQSGMSQNFNSPAIGMSSRPTKLSDRQMLILRMMSEGRTNLVISELLGYSESTVRQETIKIFAILVCHGREEASKIYREKFANLSLT
jgi:DNA-binding NarL/FixJ family response regulator